MSKEKYKYEVASNGVIRTVVKPTPWNGILLEKPKVVQVIRICPLSWHPSLIVVFARPSLIPVLSLMNAFHEML